jgi:hypothetical protein
MEPEVLFYFLDYPVMGAYPKSISRSGASRGFACFLDRLKIVRCRYALRARINLSTRTVSPLKSQL